MANRKRLQFLPHRKRLTLTANRRKFRPTVEGLEIRDLLAMPLLLHLSFVIRAPPPPHGV